MRALRCRILITDSDKQIFVLEIRFQKSIRPSPHSVPVQRYHMFVNDDIQRIQP